MMRFLSLLLALAVLSACSSILTSQDLDEAVSKGLEAELSFRLIPHQDTEIAILEESDLTAYVKVVTMVQLHYSEVWPEEAIEMCVADLTNGSQTDCSTIATRKGRPIMDWYPVEVLLSCERDVQGGLWGCDYDSEFRLAHDAADWLGEWTMQTNLSADKRIMILEPDYTIASVTGDQAGIWSVSDESVHMEVNDGFAVYAGRMGDSGDSVTGIGFNQKGLEWTWTMERQSSDGWAIEFGRIDQRVGRRIAQMIPPLPLFAQIGLVVIGLVALFLARRPVFMLHTVVLLAAVVAILAAIAGLVAGGAAAYVSIYGVNHYLIRIIGARDPIIGGIGGAVVGVAAWLIFLLLLILAGVFLAALVSTLGGKTTNIPIVDLFGNPLAYLEIWTPGPSGGIEGGGLGCGALLLPAVLPAFVVGALAGVQLTKGQPLDTTTVPWTVGIICMAILGLLGLLAGGRLGIGAGATKWAGIITGAFYGYQAANLYGGKFGLYVVSIVVLAAIGYLLMPNQRAQESRDRPKENMLSP